MARKAICPFLLLFKCWPHERGQYRAHRTDHNAACQFQRRSNAGIINIVLIENNNAGTNGSFTARLARKKPDGVLCLKFQSPQRQDQSLWRLFFAVTDMTQLFRTYRKVDLVAQQKRIKQ